MLSPARKRMTVDEFIAWAMERPETEHYELCHGEIVAMAPERLSHSQMKFEITRKLSDAIAAARLGCAAFVVGPGVWVDDDTFYQPDTIVTCKTDLDPDSLYVPDPVLVVEVLSPSTQHIDTNAKLADYFSISSLKHYLIVRLQPFILTHYAREADGKIQVRLLPGGGTITFDPPGFAIELTGQAEAGGEPH